MVADLQHPSERRQRIVYVADLCDASDAQLVTAIARYSEVALAEVYRRHGGAVYGMAIKVLRDRTEAEDVTQDIFLRLWDAPDRFDPGRGTLRTYLLTTAHSRAVDVIRSLEAKHRRELNDALSRVVTSFDVDRAFDELTTADHVQCALRDLPPDEKEVIELAYFGGHSYHQVAVLLGQPEGTVKGRIRTGLRRLRTALVATGFHGAET